MVSRKEKDAIQLDYISATEGSWSSQPQTWDRYLPMLTRLDRMSTIHGCSSMRHGVALRLGSFSRLERGKTS